MDLSSPAASPSSRQPGKGSAGLWTLFLIGVLLSFLVFLLAESKEGARRQAQFDQEVDHHVAALNQGIEQNLGNVWALAALFAASEKVSANEFAIFSRAALANSPSLLAAEWAPQVWRTERAAFEQAHAREMPGFRLVELGADGEMRPAGERDEYFPIVYMEPLAPNQRVWGFDLGSMADRLDAMNAARDSGAMRASAPLIPLQESEGSYAFLAFYPLYAAGAPTDTQEQRRQTCTGFVAGLFRIAALVERALAPVDATSPLLELALYDRPLDDPGKRLLHRRGTPAAPSAWARFMPKPLRHVTTLDIAGQRWTLVLQAPGASYAEFSFWMPWLAMASGLIFTALLTAYARQIRNRAALVEAEVGLRTHELQQSGESLARAVHDLQLSERRLQGILDNAADGIVTADQCGIIRSFNQATVEMFGYPAGEIVGRNLNMLMPEPYHSGHDGYIRHYLATGERKVIGQRREVQGLRKNGEVFPLELAVCDLALDNGSHLFIGMVRDITERKRMEQMKNEFVSTVSHELRTPLTAIRGALGLLTGAGLGAALPESAHKLLEIASNNSERLVRLINDILDMEKIESGKMAFHTQPLELMPLIRQAIEANQDYARQFGVSLKLVGEGCACRIQADSDRFLQIMTNLLSNAAKFSPPGEAVAVSVQRHGEQVRITIADRGAGIPESFRPRLFEKFAQADASDSRQKGGTGLGLSITKGLVERFGGRLGYDSEAGQGTRFHVDLPVLATAPASVGEVAERQGPAILVVEDDADVAQLLRLMLEKHGYAVDVAHDAGEAKTLLARQRYAALTLDLTLPGQSGQSLLGELRRDEDTAHLPVVVVSAVADQGKQSLSGEAVPVVDWLGKPIDEQRLAAAIRIALARPKTDKATILHVEDDPDVAHVVATLLGESAEVRAVASLGEARAALDAQAFDLVILDIGLPDGSGLNLLPRLHERVPPVPVLIFSGKKPDDERIREQVSAYLVKSRTDNLRLVETIGALIAHGNRGAANEDPD